MYAHELYEQNKPKIVVTYPGRFQPFHQGHAGVFAQLQKKFGRDSVYILTSNDTSSAKSPFNFSDKYQLMTAAGVPGDKIIETNQMYKLPDSIDAANTIFITAVGAPDADRLNPDTFTKRDQKDKEGNVTKPAGSPSYYKTWGGAETPMTADRHGYVIVIPEIHKEVTIKGKKYDVSHGTECRNLWNSIRNDANARAEFLSQMYVRPSLELAAIFDKIPQTTSEDVGADSQTSTSPIHGIKEQTQYEAFNRPYKTKSEKSGYGDVDMLAKLPDGTNLSIMFNHGIDNEWQVQFYRNNSQEVTGEGDAQRIFATVLNAIQKFIKKQKPQRLTFSASKEPEADMVATGAHANPESRAKLYDRLVQRYAKALGYRAFRADNGKMVIYELSRINKDIAEDNNQSSAKTGIYQTEVFGAKAYHSKCLEKGCDWESRRFDRIKQAQDAAKKHAQTHIKPSVAEGDLQEIQRTKGDEEGLSTKDQKWGKETLSKIKMLPGSQRFGYTAGGAGSFFTGADTIIELFDVKHPQDGLRKAGFLSLRSAPWFPIKNSYQVANVGLDSEYRGTGLGQSLYGIAMKLLKMTIVADDTQTPQARSSWLRLSQVPGVSINGYASIFAQDWFMQNNPEEIYDDSALRLIRALNRADGQELGRNQDFVYVSFPVGANADKGELQSIQKGIAIYSAQHPEEGGTTNGLYARWGGQVREQDVAEDAAGVGVVAKNKKMAKDPRYSMSITKDVKPSTPKNMLRAFRLSEDSAVSEEQIKGMVKSFLPLAMKELKLKKLPKIIIKKHIESHDGQATFGRFANEEECIYLGIADRHPVDILRTLAHELVHSKQHEQGRMEPNSGDTGSPIENEANAVAGVLMRYFNKKYPDAVKSSAVSLDESLIKRYQQFKENGDEADEVKKQKNLIPYPKGTVKVDVSDVYDWYKLGQEISDLDDANPADFGKGPPQTVMAFGSEPEEHRYLKDLKRLGLKTHDIDETYSGPALKFLRPGELRGSYTDKQLLALGFKQSQNGSWYIKKTVWDKLVSDKAIAENFADGRNPGRKGLAKRTGVPTKASVSKLRQIAKDSSGEKQRMAHWMANMKSGKAKAKK